MKRPLITLIIFSFFLSATQAQLTSLGSFKRYLSLGLSAGPAVPLGKYAANRGLGFGEYFDLTYMTSPSYALTMSAGRINWANVDWGYYSYSWDIYSNDVKSPFGLFGVKGYFIKMPKSKFFWLGELGLGVGTGFAFAGSFGAEHFITKHISVDADLKMLYGGLMEIHQEVKPFFLSLTAGIKYNFNLNYKFIVK